MELVTGFAGQAHVDPIDMAHVNAVAFGHDAYLLDTQNKLEPTLETANKLVVDTGDLMIQGHHFTVVQSEEIALQSGVSGQKRNALVCARYEKAEGTGVESASWIVKYGTATTGTPADPSVTTGNILDGVDSVHDEPIFRIEYDGITPGDPILLVPEFQSNAKFRDSISPIEIQITSEIKAVKSGNHVHIRVRNFPAPSNHYSAVGTVPESWKPKDTESNALSIGGNENESVPFVEVLSSTGDVYIETKGRSGNMNGSLDYIVQ